MGAPKERKEIPIEKSEFQDKIVRDYRIIKPIGKISSISKVSKNIGEGKFSVVFKAQKLSDNS